jgi:hypothetical protein
MSAKLLQILYTFNVPASDYRQAVAPLADPIAAVPGLRWKIWPINEAESVGGGFLLFDDEASMQAFLEGPIAAQVTSHPALSDFIVKQFDIMEDKSRVTRGPV